MSRREEQELARALGRGVPEAVREVRARVRRIVAFRGYRIPRADRPDVVQDVMSQLWQAVNRRGFDAERGLWGFVEVVAARRCIDWLRSRRRTEELDERLAGGGDPLDAAIAGERRRLARAALARLDEPCRELIRLRLGLGKPYRELARLLGRGEGALRVQMHRCLDRARRELAALDGRRGSGETTADGG